VPPRTSTGCAWRAFARTAAGPSVNPRTGSGIAPLEVEAFEGTILLLTARSRPACVGRKRFGRILGAR